MALKNPHWLLPTLKPGQLPDPDERFQSVIAPLVRVREPTPKVLPQRISPEENSAAVMGAVKRSLKVSVSPVVSIPKVIKPVRLVPNTAASAAALGLGRVQGAVLQRIKPVLIAV